jgi:hypothetical protein
MACFKVTCISAVVKQETIMCVTARELYSMQNISEPELRQSKREREDGKSRWKQRNVLSATDPLCPCT